MNALFRCVVTAAVAVATGQALADITFYDRENFQGRAFTANGDMEGFQRRGFGDRAASVVVQTERWEVCDDAYYGGRCVIVRPGSYANPYALGLSNSVASVRRVHPAARFDESRYAPLPVEVAPVPLPVAQPDWRRQPQERLYQVPVRSVRAVYGSPQQRCWVDRQAVQPAPNEPSVGGVVIGGIVGGILGHQIGRGSGRDLATVGGVVAGAVVGDRVGRSTNNNAPAAQDVQRCTAVAPSGRPEYWDVSYEFRGVEHRVQMTTPPASSLTVNEAGEPRM